MSKNKKNFAAIKSNCWLWLSLLGGIVLGAIPLLLVWRAVYGDWLVSFSRYFPWLKSPFILQVLFSWRHGLISWSPIILFSLLGLIALIIKQKDIGFAFITIFLLMLYINSSTTAWHGDGAFGARRFSCLIFLFAFGLAFFFDFIINTAGKKVFCSTLVLICLLIPWNLLLLYQFEENVIIRSAAVSPATMIKNDKNILLNRIPQAIRLIPSWFYGMRFGVDARKYYELINCEPFSNDFTIDIGRNDHLFIGKNWGTEDRIEDINFRWSLRGLSTILFPLKTPSPYLLLLHCWPYTYPNSPPQSIELELNGHKLATIPIRKQSKIYKVKIPEKYLNNGINELIIISAHSIRPSYFSPTLDPRKISIAFDYFSFKRIN